MELTLPDQFFGTTDSNGNPLRSISTVYMDIRERLAEALLFDVDPKDFHAQPIKDDIVILDDGTQSRVYRKFVSGRYFEQLSDGIKRFDKDGIALCLIFGLDETTLNKTRSRTGSPFIMFVANATGESFRPIFLGYAPLIMPYPDEVLHEILTRRGCKFVDHRTWIIDTVKRQAVLRYIELVIEPLYQYEQCGVDVKIGTGSNQKQYRAYIHASEFSSDTKQSDQFGGTCHNSKYCKCRICMELNMSRFCSANYPVHDIRGRNLNCSDIRYY
jgi:hypothetical protein